MILTPDIFEGELSIGQVEQPDVAESVQWFIDKYEPRYLAKLLGATLAKAVEEQFPTPAPDPAPEQKWVDLADKVRPMLANYVYFYHQRNDETKSAGVGEVEAQAENATRTTVSYKMVRAWNEAAKLAQQFRSWIDTTTYPEYDGAITCYNADIYELKNSFGI